MTRFQRVKPRSLHTSAILRCSDCTDACIAFPVQVVVPETTTLLEDLLPNTDYNIGVVALYSDGEGPAINDAGKTRKNPKRSRAAHRAAVLCGSGIFIHP